MHSERTQVLLTPEQRTRLERIALREGRSLGAVIRDAVDAYTLPRSRPRDDALRSLLELGAPVDDWAVMKAEIGRGAVGATGTTPRGRRAGR
jgi:hypothetical protein